MAVKTVAKLGFSLRVVLLLLLLGLSVLTVVSDESQTKSVGGKQHDDNILGVRIGMTVSDALQAVFVNANRKPGPPWVFASVLNSFLSGNPMREQLRASKIVRKVIFISPGDEAKFATAMAQQ